MSAFAPIVRGLLFFGVPGEWSGRENNRGRRLLPGLAGSVASRVKPYGSGMQAMPAKRNFGEKPVFFGAQRGNVAPGAAPCRADGAEEELFCNRSAPCRGTGLIEDQASKGTEMQH